jgi:hypothetical protein
MNVYFTTNHSPFKIIYNFNHSTLLGLFPLLIDESASTNRNRKRQVIKALHENMRQNIYIYEQYAFKANKRRQKSYFLTK